MRKVVVALVVCTAAAEVAQCGEPGLDAVEPAGFVRGLNRAATLCQGTTFRDRPLKSGGHVPATLPVTALGVRTYDTCHGPV